MPIEVSEWSQNQLETAFEQRSAREQRTYGRVKTLGLGIIALSGLALAGVMAQEFTLGAPLWMGPALLGSILASWVLWFVSYGHLLSVAGEAEEVAPLTASQAQQVLSWEETEPAVRSILAEIRQHRRLCRRDFHRLREAVNEAWVARANTGMPEGQGSTQTPGAAPSSGPTPK